MGEECKGGGNSAHEPGAETRRGQGKKGRINFCPRGAGGVATREGVKERSFNGSNFFRAG